VTAGGCSVSRASTGRHPVNAVVCIILVLFSGWKMTDKTRIPCPHCGKTLTVPVSALGRTLKCPACQTPIKLEAPRAARRTAPSQSPPLGTVKPKASQKPPRQLPPERLQPELAQQPAHRDEFTRDGRRMLAAVSAAPDKFALVEPYLMQYEQPVAIAVQRQFPFSIFSDIVLLSTHRVMVFKRFFTKIDMFDINYVDFKDVTIRQGFFTSSITILSDNQTSCTVVRLITEQALNLYRLCQDIETKARIARRQFQLEENRSRTTTMQVNNLVAPPDAFPQSQRQPPLLSNRDISGVGDEERNPFQLGE